MREWTDNLCDIPGPGDWMLRRLKLMAKAPRELNHTSEIVERCDRERVPVPEGWRALKKQELCQEGDLRLWFGAWVPPDLTERYGGRGPNGGTYSMAIRPIGVEGRVISSK